MGSNIIGSEVLDATQVSPPLPPGMLTAPLDPMEPGEIEDSAYSVRRECLRLNKLSDAAGSVSMVDDRVEYVESALRPTFRRFSEQYPILFRKCCDTRFNLVKLRSILDRLNEVNQCRLTKEAAVDDLVQDLNATYADHVVRRAEEERLRGGGQGGGGGGNRL